MDWSAVAMALGERAGIPAVLLNGAGNILLVTPAAERALGWNYRYLGAAWLDRCVATGLEREGRWLFERAVIGAVRRFELRVATAEGPRLARFEALAVGADDERGVLLIVEEVLALPAAEPTSDYDYEVRGYTRGVFEMQAFCAIGRAEEPIRGRCYEVLHGRSAACEGCPLTQFEAIPGSRLAVRTLGDQQYREYEVVSAVALDEERARVSVRRLSSGAFPALLQAKLEELSERAKLSERERVVLKHLVAGAALDEIASALNIGVRTVKFHQANLLAKLGADSRSDLMRLVL
jgi:DNA-binding CsgD family transcriptional regulator